MTLDTVHKHTCTENFSNLSEEIKALFLLESELEFQEVFVSALGLGLGLGLGKLLP